MPARQSKALGVAIEAVAFKIIPALRSTLKEGLAGTDQCRELLPDRRGAAESPVDCHAITSVIRAANEEIAGEDIVVTESPWQLIERLV
jgi:hypothetical protein